MIVVTPITETASIAINGDEPSITRVAILFRARRPFYIALFVMAFVIDALNGMGGRRAFAQLCIKLLKGFKAKFDTSASVVIVSRYVGILASCLSCLIGLIFDGVAASYSLPVFNAACASGVSAEASTRSANVSSQCFTYNVAPLSTIASTQPQCIPVRGFAIQPKNKVSLKPPSCKIAKIGSCGRERLERYAKVQFRHFDLLERLKCLGSQFRAIGAVGRFYYST